MQAVCCYNQVSKQLNKLVKLDESSKKFKKTSA